MQPYFEDEHASLYLGDARNLDLIPDESVDCILMSPPYWGKRSYGDETVAVWGGEKDCQHQWAFSLSARGDKSGPHGPGSTIGAKAAQDAPRRSGATYYCSLCGCWRGSLGLEPTWQLYIDHLCDCAREWWRVLKPTGNLFINMGDTFCADSHIRQSSKEAFQQYGDDTYDDCLATQRAKSGRVRRNFTSQGGIPKMKLGIPYRLRFALNDMGWLSRDDIIWFKGKEYEDGHISKVAMPESVKRRLACSYEIVLRFVKTPRMNYCVNGKTLESRDRPPKERVEGTDFEWRIHEACEGRGCDKPRCKDGKIKYSFWHGVDQWFDLDAIRTSHLAGWGDYKTLPKSQRPNELPRASGMGLNMMGRDPAGANPGDVWIIQAEPFKLKHYAVWPSELCRRVISVACPREVCPKCGKPRERITEPSPEYAKHLGRDWADYEQDQTEGRGHFQDGGYKSASLPTKRKAPALTADYHTIGWSDCGCEKDGYIPGVVLDPFCGGSGRAARMARKLGRRFIGVDLKEEYLEMSRECYLQDETEEIKQQMEAGAQQGVLL